MDQWDYEGITLSQYFEHRLTAADLFAQHNESHLVLARIVSLLLAPLTGWDIRYEVGLTVVLVVLLALGFNILIARTTLLTRPQQICCAIVTDLSLCASTQWEVLLFGAYYFVVPGVALVWCLVAARAKWPLAVKAITWCSLSLVATLAYINGVLLWLLLVPSTLLSRASRSRDRLAILLFYVIGAAVLTAYFATFDRPQQHPDYRATVFGHVPLLTYYLVWIGAPLGHVADNLTVSLTAGAALLLLQLGLSAYLLRWHWTSVFAGAWDWIVLGGFVLITGAAISVGRAGFGIEQALASRYHSFSLLLPPTVLVLSLIAANLAWTRRESVVTGIAFMLGVGACLFAFSYVAGWSEARSYGKLRHRAQLAVQFVDLVPDNPQLSLAYPGPGRLVQISRDLRPFRLPHIRLAAGRLMWQVQQTTSTGDRTNGLLERVIDMGDGRLRIRGWAILKDRTQPADCALIVWQDEKGSVKPISVLPVDVRRSDVAAALGKGSVVNSGFDGVISRSNIPGPGTIGVWSVDLKAVRIYQVGGTKGI